MVYEGTTLAAWIIVAVVGFLCFIAILRLTIELHHRRSLAAFRGSTIIISRTSLEDSAATSLSVERLRVLGFDTHGGDVCFLVADRPPLAPGQEPCFICCASGAVDIVGPCGHGGMCGACFVRVWGGLDPKCPVCRSVLPPV